MRSATTRSPRSRIAFAWPGWWWASVCIALGVVATIGAAWGLKVTNRFDDVHQIEADLMSYLLADPGVDTHGEHREAWPTRVPGDWPDHQSFYIVTDRFGYRAIVAVARHNKRPHESISYRYGWPMLALTCGFAEQRGTWQLSGPWHTGVAIGAPDPTSTDPPLPIQPIWPSFAINTFFYALLPWTLITLTRTLRNHRRRKRGHCAACNYDLSGLTPPLTTCPECGRPP